MKQISKNGNKVTIELTIEEANFIMQSLSHYEILVHHFNESFIKDCGILTI